MPVTEFACSTCDLRFSLGWYHGGEFNGWSTSLLACSGCCAQHQMEIAPRVEESRSVEITNVPENDRKVALRLICKYSNCTPIEAKARLDHLPVRLAERVHPNLLGEWTEQVTETGITLDFPVFEQQHSDRLLGARNPRHFQEKVEWQEVDIKKRPLPTNEEIQSAIERYSLGELEWEKVLTLTRLQPNNNQIELPIQQCVCCAATGTLSGQLEHFATCPSCKQATLEAVSQSNT